MKKKTKKRSSTFYRKHCVKWAKDEAKKLAGYKCEYCGKTKEQGWQMHGSHILPEGAYPLMSAEPKNIICLCAEHHVAGMSSYMGNSRQPSWHGDPIFFAGWFNKKWPNRYKELRDMDKEVNRHVINWEKKWQEIKYQQS